MGILGLANLVYFGEHYGDVFQRLVAAQRKLRAGKLKTARQLLRLSLDAQPVAEATLAA